MLDNKFAKDNNATDISSYIKFLKNNNYQEWLNNYNQRIKSASTIMEGLGIGNRIIEFNNTVKNKPNRLLTYSDILTKDNYNATISSRYVDSGNIDGINYRTSIYNDFGDFNEYISTNTSEYDTVDSFIIEDFYDRIEKFLPTFLTLGKDCYYVINCANDANSKTYYEQVCLDLLKIANKCKDVDVEIVESIDETNYVKVIKMKKAGK